MRHLFKPLVKVAVNAAQVKPVNEFYKNGFSIIKPDFYSPMSSDAVTQVLSSYKELPKDEYSKGNRYRAYSRFNWCSTHHVASLDPSNNYFQGKDYNPQDGDKVRQFEKISDQFLTNPIVEDMFIRDVEIARRIDRVNFNDNLEIGLHQIRYKASQDDVAFSSPAWLHRDDEPVVFVHVCHYSNNMVGGDNIIANSTGSRSEITRAVRLKQFETLLLSKDVLHAVTPISSCDETDAVRDILLVTFQNKKARSNSNVPDKPIESAKDEPLNTMKMGNKGSSLVSNMFTTFYKNTAKEILNLTKTPGLNPV